MDDFKAFTIKANGRLNQLVTTCGVSDAVIPDSKIKPNIKSYQAIWDTGATGTVITKKVADELGLKPTGVVTSKHAGGSSQVNTYLVNIYLPQGIRIIGVKVIDAVLSGNTEMLIGMDIICLGDFSITNLQGETCFSFRIPSKHKVDFVEEFNNKKKIPGWLQKRDKKGFIKG